MRGLMSVGVAWRVAALGLGLAAAPAQATVHVFELTGHAADGSYRHVGASYSAFIDLSDASSASGLLPARTVAVGDTLSATIHFDQAVLLPASAAQPQPYAAHFGFDLGWFDPDRVQGGTTLFFRTQVRFFDGAAEVFPGPAAQAQGGCGNLLCVGSTYVPATGNLHFDRVEMASQIDAIARESSLDQVWTLASPGQFSAFVLTPVPEPASVWQWLAGLAGLGWVGRCAGRPLRARRSHGGAAPVATAAALCMLSACGGGSDGPADSADSSSTDRSTAARPAALVVPMLLAEDGSVMPSIPDAEPAQPGPRTRSARYATRAQAAQLAAALDQKVLWVDAADLFARGDRLAAAAAVLLRETVQPDAAPEPGAQGDVPVFVTGDDAASAAAAADLLSAHGLRLVWWVTR